MNSKLHPIYVALDSHQYNKAIKLCLALPKDNIMALALLAHAYNKSLQRHKALLTLQSILGTEGFQELQLECRYSMETWTEIQTATATSANAPQHQPQPTSSGAKKGKKGKKKPTAPPPKPIPQEKPVVQNFSLIGCLDKPPTIDKNWETLPPSDKAIIDEVGFSGVCPFF